MEVLLLGVGRLGLGRPNGAVHLYRVRQTEDKNMNDILSGINNAITIVGRLREVSKNIAEVEFKNLLADLSGELADAKLQIADLKERVALQAQEIQALKRGDPTSKQKPSGKKWGCYQFEGEEGLFCTGCYDARGVKSQTNRLDPRHRSCPVCRATIGS